MGVICFQHKLSLIGHEFSINFMNNSDSFVTIRVKVISKTT